MNRWHLHLTGDCNYCRAGLALLQQCLARDRSFCRGNPSRAFSLFIQSPQEQASILLRGGPTRQIVLNSGLVPLSLSFQVTSISGTFWIRGSQAWKSPQLYLCRANVHHLFMLFLQRVLLRIWKVADAFCRNSKEAPGAWLNPSLVNSTVVREGAGRCFFTSNSRFSPHCSWNLSEIYSFPIDWLTVFNKHLGLIHICSHGGFFVYFCWFHCTLDKILSYCGDFPWFW